MKFKEVEFKYAIPKLKYSDFKTFAESLGPSRYIEAAGYDYYYTDDAGMNFIRYRAGDRQELTTKRKTKTRNNYVRDEYNLLIGKGQTLETVAGFCRSLGYPRLNFCIFKACFIYFYDTFDIVYYVVYDEDMKETDRFLEIEMAEDHAWASEQQCWDKLKEVEQSLAPLGIKPEHRESKSLFEMYRAAD